MKTIFLFCLANVRTGGPEAIHQLSDALLEQGFDARMVFYKWSEIAALERADPGDGFWYRFGLHGNSVEDYAAYKIQCANEVPNSPDSIIVLPETLCHLAPKFHNSTVLIWWLSVDNGFGALSRVNLNHLRAENVWHASQSDYAARFIDAMRFPDAGSLSDYTVDLSHFGPPIPMAERHKTIVFNANPHKVIASFDDFRDRMRAINPEILVVKAQGTRAQMAMLFAQARVYVDLGSMPGKDRMPREAAAMGCGVLVRADAGAAGDLLPRVMGCDGSIEQAASYAADLIARPQPASLNIEAERAKFFDEAHLVFHDLSAELENA